MINVLYSFERGSELEYKADSIWTLNVSIFQVGNAVPPPLAAAIGREIKKSLVAGSKSS